MNKALLLLPFVTACSTLPVASWRVKKYSHKTDCGDVHTPTAKPYWKMQSHYRFVNWGNCAIPLTENNKLANEIICNGPTGDPMYFNRGEFRSNKLVLVGTTKHVNRTTYDAQICPLEMVVTLEPENQ